ncbi:hypothetical protein ACFX15_045275 [Malus domestica]
MTKPGPEDLSHSRERKKCGRLKFLDFHELSQWNMKRVIQFQQIKQINLSLERDLEEHLIKTISSLSLSSGIVLVADRASPGHASDNNTSTVSPRTNGYPGNSRGRGRSGRGGCCSHNTWNRHTNWHPLGPLTENRLPTLTPPPTPPQYQFDVLCQLCGKPHHGI